MGVWAALAPGGRVTGALWPGVSHSALAPGQLWVLGSAARTSGLRPPARQASGTRLHGVCATSCVGTPARLGDGSVLGPHRPGAPLLRAA